MYDVRPNLIIGFHGCDASVRDQLLTNPDKVKVSKEPYDWLGHGMYFWENNYDRALEWAKDKKKRGAINDPAVIGAVLHLGYCCDLLDSKYIKILRTYFEAMEMTYEIAGLELPVNKDLPKDANKDKILRELDCAAIEYMHNAIFTFADIETKTQGYTDYKIFDSTRCVFTEGGPAFKGAGLLEKSHIQICIRNLNCIKGFFLPRKETDFMTYLKGK